MLKTSFKAVLIAGEDENGFPATFASLSRWFAEKGIVVSEPVSMEGHFVVEVDLNSSQAPERKT